MKKWMGFLLALIMTLSAVLPVGAAEMPAEKDFRGGAAQGAVARSVGELLQAVCLQPDLPDLENELKDLQKELSAQITDFSADEVQIGRANALADLYDTIRKDPENAAKYEAIFTGLLGDAPEHVSVEAQAAYAESVGNLLGNIARRPGTKDTLLAVQSHVCPAVTALTDDAVLTARGHVESTLYEGAARNPESAEALEAIFTDLLGKKPETSSAAVQAASAESVAGLLMGIAFDPETAPLLQAMHTRISPAITSPVGDAVLIARGRVEGVLYDGVARNPDEAETLETTFTDLLGAKPEKASAAVQAASAESVAGLLIGMARSSEAIPLLPAIRARISPAITTPVNEAVLIARGHAESALYEGVARNPEMAETLETTFTDLLGAKPEKTSAAVQAASAESVGKLLEGIARQPEAKDSLLTIHARISPAVTVLTDDAVLIARGHVESALYDGATRQPEVAGTLETVFTDLLGAKPEKTSAAVQAASAESISKLLNGIVRQPEMADSLLAMHTRISPAITDLTCEEICLVRAGLSGAFYGYLGRAYDDGRADPVISAFIEMLGDKPESASAAVQVLTMEGYVRLLAAAAEYPAYAGQLLKAAQDYFPVVTDIHSEEVQAARGRVMGGLYAAIAQSPEIKDNLVKMVRTLTGGAVDINHYRISFDAAGGTAVDPQYVFAHNTAGDLPVTERDQYIFLGWYAGDQIFSAETPITGPVRLKARWRADTSAVEPTINTVSPQVLQPAAQPGTPQAEKDAMEKASEAIRKAGAVQESGLNKAVSVKKNAGGDFVIEIGAEAPVIIPRETVEQLIEDNGITETSVVAEAFLKIQVTGAETDSTAAITSITFDIKPFVNVNLKGAGFFQTLATKTVENVTEPVAITLTLPEGFTVPEGHKIQVKHVKEDGTVYYYDAQREGNQITFVNPNGFSTFTVQTVPISAKTGDDSHAILWANLAVAAACGAAYVVLYQRRKKEQDQ